jgi:hypothetical protein
VVMKLLWIIYSLWGPMSTAVTWLVYDADIHVVCCIECFLFWFVFCCCQFGDTAFQWACRKEHIRIAEKLIRAGADINIRCTLAIPCKSVSLILPGSASSSILAQPLIRCFRVPIQIPTSRDWISFPAPSTGIDCRF